MKFLRVGDKYKEKPAVIDKAGTIKDLSSIIEDINPNSIEDNLIDKVKKIDLNIHKINI